MKYFDNNGCFRIGIHQGTHFSKLDPSYVGWASKNLSGFTADLDALHDRCSPSSTFDMKSSCGHGGIKNAGLAPPGQRRFVSRNARPSPPEPATEEDDSPPW